MPLYIGICDLVLYVGWLDYAFTGFTVICAVYRTVTVVVVAGYPVTGYAHGWRAVIYVVGYHVAFTDYPVTFTRSLRFVGAQ